MVDRISANRSISFRTEAHIASEKRGFLHRMWKKVGFQWNSSIRVHI